LAGVGSATVPRAFVSVSGSDSNPCSAVQPCRSFNQALTVVEAGGEIVVQNSGGFSTGFTITQSVTIDAAGFNASVISTDIGDLCTINAGASDRIVLRGISFHGAHIGTNAIDTRQAGSLYVEHCSISEFTDDAVAMELGGNLFVTDTDIRACNVAVDVGSDGATTSNLVAQDSRFAECNQGITLSAAGPGTTGAATGWASNCTASLCSIGFQVYSNCPATADLTLSNCRAVGNTDGLAAKTFSTGNATMRITNCEVAKNQTGISVSSSGGGIASVVGTSPGTNLIAGNGTNGSVASSTTLQ
jgi:hypothetical protein